MNVISMCAAYLTRCESRAFSLSFFKVFVHLDLSFRLVVFKIQGYVFFAASLFSHDPQTINTEAKLGGSGTTLNTFTWKSRNDDPKQLTLYINAPQEIQYLSPSLLPYINCTHCVVAHIFWPFISMFV